MHIVSYKLYLRGPKCMKNIGFGKLSSLYKNEIDKLSPSYKNEIGNLSPLYEN
jgi:hypothetical protein